MTELETHYAICPLCEANCGIAIQHRGSTIVEIRGDARDPHSKGHICPKAAALQDLHEDPDRLRRPLRRRSNGDFEEIGWEEAISVVAERLHAIQARYGRDAVSFYYGNPTAHSFTAQLYLLPFIAVLDSRNTVSSHSIDALPRLMTSFALYGNQALLPVPDVDRCDTMVIIGANPVVSNGSIMTAPGIRRRLEAIQARGGHITVLDPRRTRTAQLADEHLFIQPGTDALLLAAVLRQLEVDDLIDLGAAAPHCDGHRAVLELVAPFLPERVGPLCGISPEAIVALARRIGRSPRAVVYGRLGTCVQTFGALSTWLIDLINIMSGNFDAPGGLMFSTGPIDLADVARMTGNTGSFDTFRSRVSDLPEFNGEVPVATLVEEIETPGPGQVRALITHAGNPVLSHPDGARLDRALAQLDFICSIDIYLNETTRHADMILPPTGQLERDHFPLIFHNIAVRNGAHFAPALFEKPPGSRHDYEIISELMCALMAQRGPKERLAAAALRQATRRLSPRQLIDAGLRAGPYKLKMRDLLEAPHGIDLGPLVPRLPGVLATDNARIRLDHPIFLSDWPRLLAELDSGQQAKPSLTLIGRRHLRSNNSWMHNSARLTKGRERCVLLVHPDDARAHGIDDGDVVELSSEAGSVQIAVRLSDEVMPGVVCMPHGYGHDRDGVALRIASQRPGVSMNDLTDRRRYDALSGTSVLNGIPVTLRSTR